jgi:carboxypeptidase family protein
MRNRILFIFVLVSILPALISAQVAVTGKITGVVTDSSGAAVPNAMVTVKGNALMSPRSTSTGSEGAYLFDLLPPGTYEVTVRANGFQTFDETGVEITAGFTATVNPKLQLGEVQQTVKVESEPVVDVQNVQSSTTFDQNLLQDIPSGRDPWSTVAQVPGATISSVDVGGNQSYQQSTMQVHGSTPGEQVFSFNGLDLNWPGANGGYTQFYTDHDSFDEFQVVSDNAPASVAIGGVYMNMVTKSGSNQWHGQAAAYYASAGFEAGAKSPIFDGNPVKAASPINQDRDTTVGAGGPILKDRLWIFGSYRRYDLREDVLSIVTDTGGPGVDVDHTRPTPRFASTGRPTQKTRSASSGSTTNKIASTAATPATSLSPRRPAGCKSSPPIFLRLSGRPKLPTTCWPMSALAITKRCSLSLMHQAHPPLRLTRPM